MSAPSSARSFSLRRGRVRVPARVGVPMALALTLFLTGPRATVDADSLRPVQVEGDPAAWVARTEASVPGIRPGDQAEVVWADPQAPDTTPLSLVFLHGFSADRHEMDPVPARLADSLGANLLFTRLTGHGRDGPALAEATAEDWLQDAQEALVVATALGRRVVLVGSSTGATLALWAALRAEERDRVAALVLFAPNFQPADPSSRLLLLPWGELLARLVVGPERCFEPASPEQARHWTYCYPVGALPPMMALVERVRTEELSELRTPTLILYSPEDRVVDAGETEAYFQELGASRKRLVVVEDGGPSNHLLAGDIGAPQNNDRVVSEVLDFLRDTEVADPAGSR